MKYLRIYADAAGESHFEDVEMPMETHTTVTNVKTREWHSMPIGNGFRFNTVDPDSGDPAASGEWGPWHPEPRPEFIIRLSGEMEIQVSDGDVRHLGPGDILLAEDTTGRGHRNRRLASDMRTLFIPLAGE